MLRILGKQIPGIAMAKLHALLIALSVLAFAAPPASLAANLAGPAVGERPLPLAEPVRAGDRCPRLCVEWFDGCHTCSCAHGYINVCSENVCRVRRRARCLRQGF